MRLPLVILAGSLAVWCVPGRASAQAATDSAAIRATALDYVEGWYAGDGARMGRSLHPELAKRIMRRGETGVVLESMTAAQLVAVTARGVGRDTPRDRQEKRITILDIFGNAASVRATMSEWIDYMHLAKDAQGRWVIVNVLWERKPTAR